MADEGLIGQIDTAAANAATFDALLRAYAAVHGRDRGRSRWVMSEATAETLRAVKDSRGGPCVDAIHGRRSG